MSWKMIIGYLLTVVIYGAVLMGMYHLSQTEIYGEHKNAVIMSIMVVTNLIIAGYVFRPKAGDKRGEW